MSKDFENECRCNVCQCDYIAQEGEPRDRCQAHMHLPAKVEEDVKYLHKDISSTQLADRIEVLENKVADLMNLVKAKKASFVKTCEDCKKKFSASAPAVKKCDECKKKGN